jgi:hypothetical protein
MEEEIYGHRGYRILMGQNAIKKVQSGGFLKTESATLSTSDTFTIRQSWTGWAGMPSNTAANRAKSEAQTLGPLDHSPHSSVAI